MRSLSVRQKSEKRNGSITPLLPGELTSPSTPRRQEAYASFNPNRPCCKAVHES